MANMSFTVFNAFRKAGVDEETARTAAEEIAKLSADSELNQINVRLAKLETDLGYLKWITGATFLAVIATLLKDIVG